MKRRDRDNQRTFTCPNCGADVPVGRRACPECGSDDKTGWSEEAETWSADIPGGFGGDDFDYDEFVAREFGAPEAGRSVVPARRLLGTILAIAAILGLVFVLLHYSRWAMFLIWRTP